MIFHVHQAIFHFADDSIQILRFRNGTHIPSKRKAPGLTATMSWNPFTAPSRSGTEWFSVGPSSSFPDLGDDGALSQPKPCGADVKPGCKVFHVPKENSTQRTEIPVTTEHDPETAGDLTDQVLVFRFRGKIHAVDHVRP